MPPEHHMPRTYNGAYVCHLWTNMKVKQRFSYLIGCRGPSFLFALCSGDASGGLTRTQEPIRNNIAENNFAK